MKRIIRFIEGWVRRCDDRLHRKLDSLSPQKRLAVVLSLFAVFALYALASIGSAVFRMGSDRRQQMEIKHINRIDFPQKQDSINTLKQYNYGTERTGSTTQSTGND